MPLFLRAQLAALALLPVIAACGQTETRVADVQVRDQTVAAFVNGEPVFEGDVELEAVARGLISAGQAFGPDDDEYRIVLDQLIDQKLMAQEAARRQLDRDPSSQRRLEMARERIMGNLLVESLVAKEVTEEAIDRMYAEQVRLQQANDQVSVAHILKVKDRRTEPPKTREEMRPEIATFLTLNEVSRILRRLRTEANIEQGSGQTYVPTTDPVPQIPQSPPGDDDL
ncbi:MAG: hypothetical protein MUE84_14980 [Hyphomonas sp.]|nr:hypothetical protein [Hyphomonas sp.]